VTDKAYRIHGQHLTLGEAGAFISEYAESIRAPTSRYMQILAHVPPGTYVLDYGCGWGCFSQMLTEHGCTVDGIDIDPDSIAIARDIVHEKDRLTFALEDISEITEETYDVVVSTQVAEHTHNPGNYVVQCNRVLKIGGYLVISVPNVLNPRFFLSTLIKDHHSRYRRISTEIREHYDKTQHHIQAWDPAAFCRFLCSLGFEYVDHTFMEGIALPRGKYWHTAIPRIGNWSYTMMFKVKKYQYVDVQSLE
jgi:2-polyprenyl-3-methyl-5-hydroxy-6-metoxy-1,4-benzoquinol methylase